ncbi:MAG: hypothetical protein WBD47_15630 [Phormidesmis sp.]
MATLLHFLRSLAVTLLTSFLLALVTISGLFAGLMALNISPVAFVVEPLYIQIGRFLLTFGGGDRIEGIVAIALTVSIVTTLMSGFTSYKRRQRFEWHLAMSSALKD